MLVATKNSKYMHNVKRLIATAIISLVSVNSFAEIKLEKQVHLTDLALFFDGVKKSVTQARTEPYVEGQKYNFAYGRSIVPHGDAIKVHKGFVYLTWYRGGLLDRHMMLTRYNLKTGTKVDIEFPHQHTGFEGRWWVGETHNTIAVGISPKDDTIHLLFDMHAYTPGKDTGGNGSFEHDYFRYSYSVPGAAIIDDDKFTLEQFVKDTGPNNEGPDDYKHVTMTGVENVGAFGRLTYPKFFLNDQGDMFMSMRQGSSHDGSLVFNRYLPEDKKWSSFTRLNVLGAGDKGDVKNWSIYGSPKFQNGKMRVGFQRRLNRQDKFYANEGMFYAYSDDPSGQTDWKNYKGELFTIPLIKPDDIQVFDPSTLLPEATDRHQVSITGGFDWAVTANEDVHIIGRTSERVNNRNVRTIYSHHYQVRGKGEFITTTDFAGANELYPAGDDIYIIGLDNDRPFVEKAKGGTNDFTRVYQAPADSMAFEKGRIHIYEGKIYYYLLEKGSGDTRTTHLQIIDLDIKPAGPSGYQYASNKGETVSVTGIMNIAYGAGDDFVYLMNQTQDVSCNAQTFSVTESDEEQACFTLDVTPTISFVGDNIVMYEGYDSLTIDVDTATPAVDRSVAQVTLYVGDAQVSIDTEAPYQWTEASSGLNALPVGKHVVKAVVTDSTGISAETTMDITIKAKVTPSIAFTQSEMALTEEFQEIAITVNAQTSDDSQDIQKVALYLKDELIAEDLVPPFQWGAENSALLAMGVGTHQIKAVLTDAKGATSETVMSITVNAKPTPAVAFSDASLVYTEGYSSISITADAQTTADTKSVKSVSLYLNDTAVSTKESAPYQWSQSSAQLAGLAPGSYTLKAVLTDDNGATSEATKVLTVNAKPQESGSGNGAGSSSSGGGSASFIAVALLALLAFRRKYTL